MATSNEFQKDPDEVLDFAVDFAAFLGAQTIASHSVEADAGITVDTTSASGTKVTMRLSGGTIGERYRVTAEITTSTGQVKQQSIFITILEV